MNLYILFRKLSLLAFLLTLGFVYSCSTVPPKKRVVVKKNLTPEEQKQKVLDDKLISCTKQGSLECVKAAVEAGGSVNAIDDEEGNTPLIIAASNDPSRIVVIDPEKPDQPPIPYLSLPTDTNLDNKIVKRDFLQNYEITEYLISKGADVNKVNLDEYSPLMKACLNQYLNIVELLVNNKANIEAKSKFGETPLYLTAIVGSYDIINYLISKGASVNVTNRNKYTPLMRAASHGYGRIAESLLKNKADINAQSEKGITALMLASSNGYLNTVKVILKSKPDLSLKDKKGLTALKHAELNKKEDIVNELKLAGAKE